MIMTCTDTVFIIIIIIIDLQQITIDLEKLIVTA